MEAKLKDLPWSKFYWADWSRDAGLRACSYAAKGLWMDMLCQMDASPERGFLIVGNRAATPHEIARIVGGERRTVDRLLNELEANGVFSRDDRNAIFSRRMTRECDISRRNIANGKLGGNPVLKKTNGLDKKPVNQPDKAETETETETETERLPPPLRGAEADADFAIWYAAYPRKVGRDNAAKAYTRARKRMAVADLLLAVRTFPFDHNRPEFIPHPATWLNQGRWADTIEHVRPASRAGPARQTAASAWAERYGLLDNAPASNTEFDIEGVAE